MKDGVGDHLSSGVGDEAEPGSSEDVESEVAAALGPFVGLLSKNSPDESDDRVAVWEDADAVGAATDLPVQPLVRVV